MQSWGQVLMHLQQAMHFLPNDGKGSSSIAPTGQFFSQTRHSVHAAVSTFFLPIFTRGPGARRERREAQYSPVGRTRYSGRPAALPSTKSSIEQSMRVVKSESSRTESTVGVSSSCLYDQRLVPPHESGQIRLWSPSSARPFFSSMRARSSVA